MRLVIADTGPVNYLVLIGHIEILRALFETVVLPSVVRDELADRGAPPAVRQWIADPPAWIEMRDASGAGLGDSSLERLDAGEAAAIILAIELSADLLLIDDRAGVIAARHKGFRVAGTLGILGMAAQHGLLDLADAFSRLKRTSFHCRPEIMDRFLNDAPGNK